MGSVGPAEIEHQEHLRAPAADAVDGDQALGGLGIFHAACFGKRRDLAGGGAAGEVAQRRAWVADAGAADPGVGQRQ
jgi:hypothetical protein